MLRKGQRITINGLKYRVQYVNFTGAFVIPLHPVARVITIKRTGEQRVLKVKGPGMVISANSVDC